jgi:nucleobase:cation symporter-1, NCS1 family
VSAHGAGVDAGTIAAVEGSWPVLPNERTWGPWALFGISVSTAVATWCFLIGGYVGYYLKAGPGTMAMLAGALVGILLIMLATVPVATRYGVDSVAASKPQLGSRGSYLSLILLYTTVIGWNCLLLIFLGRAAAEILVATGVADEGLRHTLTIAFSLVSVVAVWLLLRGGPDTVKSVGPFIAGGVLLLGCYILFLLVDRVGWDHIVAAKPAYADSSKLWNYTTGFEIMVASVLSWWPYAGGMVRLVPSARTAKWPVVFGLGVPVAIVSIIGLWAGLAIKDSGGDPTTFLTELGGLGAGIPALLFIVLANVATVMVGVYVSALGLKQLPVLQRRLSWNWTTAVTLIPVAFVVLVIPDYFFSHIGSFLAFMGVLFAPMCGMQIADYYLFRRERIDVRALFRAGPGSAYHFWFGINPAGIAALAAGFVTYTYLLDPVAYTTHSPYQYVSASVPAAVVAASIYALVTRLVVIPRAKGGYAQAVE